MDSKIIEKAFQTYEEAKQKDIEDKLQKLHEKYSTREINILIEQVAKDKRCSRKDATEYVVNASDKTRDSLFAEHDFDTRIYNSEYNKQARKALQDEIDDNQPATSDSHSHKATITDEDKINHLIIEPAGSDEMGAEVSSENETSSETTVDGSEEESQKLDETATAEKSLGEEIIDIDDKEAIKKAAEELKKDSSIDDAVPVIDVKTNEEKEQKDINLTETNILSCCDCGGRICLTSEELISSDDNPEIYNTNIPCPYCQQEDGYQLVDGPEEKRQEEEEATEAQQQGEIQRSDEINFEQEIDDVDETSFEEGLNKYFTEVYQDIDSFKCSNIKTDKYIPRKLIVEGNLVLKNNKEVPTTFELFAHKNSFTGNDISFRMKNASFSKKVDFPFTGTAKNNNRKLIFESISYNYTTNYKGETVLVQG